MCLDYCEAGAHHHHAPIKDWRRAWETSKVEPITLEPVDRLTITCLIDNVVDPLSQSSFLLSWNSLPLVAERHSLQALTKHVHQFSQPRPDGLYSSL